MQEDTKRTATRYSDESATSRKIEQRLTVHEAAPLLGLSVDAARKRAERGSFNKGEKPQRHGIYRPQHRSPTDQIRNQSPCDARLDDGWSKPAGE